MITMENFEEQFPSLNGKMQEGVYPWYSEDDVYENCLDKQRVREVLDEIGAAEALLELSGHKRRLDGKHWSDIIAERLGL